MPLSPDVPYPELSYAVNGAGMAVHTALRHGLREEVYQNAMEKELANRGIEFVREYMVEVLYEGEVVGRYYLDFWIEGKLVLELKALPYLFTNREVAQTLRYMQVTDSRLGLIHNFGLPQFKLKRLTPPLSWGHYEPAKDPWLIR